MESLHAPWRIQYILGPKLADADGRSLFAIIGQSGDDVTHHVICRAKTCFALLNTYPYNAGHTLICPYRQVADLPELTDEEAFEMQVLLRRVQTALRQVMHPDGFNVGLNLGKVAGAGIVEHLHWHIVPRWSGDTNFMPVTGSTNVLPEALDETAARLRTAMAQSL
ncbi:MAG: HIT domain-containing protein [Limisphaerales bacterium]